MPQVCEKKCFKLNCRSSKFKKHVILADRVLVLSSRKAGENKAVGTFDYTLFVRTPL